MYASNLIFFVLDGIFVRFAVLVHKDQCRNNLPIYLSLDLYATF